MTTTLASSLLPNWINPEVLIPAMGPWVVLGLCAILLAECGLLLGFFLPGDTLLFFTGIFHASGAIKTPLWLLMLYMSVAAFIGNMVGYWIGHKAGPTVFSKPSAKYLKPEYLEKSHAMFERWGKPAVMLSRFVPVIRTIAPPMAGASRMNVRVYTLFSFIGGVIWIVVVTMLGVWLGDVPLIRDHLDLVIVAAVAIVVLFSAGPAIWHMIERRKQRPQPEQVAVAAGHTSTTDPTK